MKKIVLCSMSILIAAPFGTSSTARAEDWTQFRGPGSAGVSEELSLPTSWSGEENVVWKTKLPGPGSSSPITLGDKIYLTCYSGYGVDKMNPGDIANLKRHLICLDRSSGQILWDSPVAAKLPEQAYIGFQQQHGYASSTPVTDGQNLYVYYGRSGVYAFDLEGKELWNTEVGTGTHVWGTATSPVVFGDLVIVNASIESGALVALNKQTGREAWRAEGVLETWGSPSLVELPDGETELVVTTKGSVQGFEPATGEKLWTCASPDYTVCTTPISENGIIYATGGRKKELLAIRAGGRGDVTDTHVLWKQDIGSNIPSPVLYEGKIYDVDSRGLGMCVDAATGEVIKRERVPDAGGVYASLTAADGKLYLITREKGAFVLAAGDDLDVIAHNEIKTDSSIFNASPIVSRGELLIRSDENLYCIGSGG